MEKKLVKIARSFSMKKNLGNYQTADFWMMQEIECEEGEAEKKSEEIYQFVKGQVLKSYNEYGVVAPSVKIPPEQEYEKTVDFGALKPSIRTKDEIDQIIRDAKPRYMATDREGGRKLINKKENTFPPQ